MPGARRTSSGRCPARHGTRRGSFGGTAQPRAAAAPGEDRHGAVTCPWSGGGCSASSGSSGSQGTGQPTAGAESSSGGGAAPTLRSPGTAHAQGGSAGHSRGGGRLAAGAGSILHGTGLRRARRPVKLRSAPAADGGSGTAPPRGTARAGRSGAEPQHGALGPCGGSRDVAARGSFEGGRTVLTPSLKRDFRCTSLQKGFLTRSRAKRIPGFGFKGDVTRRCTRCGSPLPRGYRWPGSSPAHLPSGSAGLLLWAAEE